MSYDKQCIIAWVNIYLSVDLRIKEEVPKGASSSGINFYSNISLEFEHTPVALITDKYFITLLNFIICW